jgi:hypothetical protein
VQRHRHNQLAVFDQALARPRQPLRKAWHQLQPVGMLERQDGSPARSVIGDDGASAVEGWWLGQAGGTARAFTRIDAERQAAAVAQGSVKKGNLAPARRAETVALAQRFTAGNTERRKQQIRDFPIQRHCL